MMYEEEGTIVGSTGTQSVGPVSVKGIPPATFKSSATGSLAINLARLFTFSGANQQYLVKVKQGDVVDAVCELVGISDKADGTPGMLWSLKDLSINDSPVRVPPGLQPRAKPGTEVPPGERMKFSVSFNINQPISAAIATGTGGDMPDRVMRTIMMYIRDSVRAA